MASRPDVRTSLWTIRPSHRTSHPARRSIEPHIHTFPQLTRSPEDHDRLDVWCVGKHVHGLHRVDLIAARGDSRQVARERLRVAGNVSSGRGAAVAENVIDDP